MNGLGIIFATFTIGSFAVAAVSAVSRLFSGVRVWYKDGQYLVSVRRPGEWHDIRDFVQPGSPAVVALYSQLGSNTEACLDWVCRNIDYRRDIGEWWSSPAETIDRGFGDCEDSTFVFVSLARNFNPNIWAVLGSYHGYGHSWASENGFIYETTYTQAQPVPDPENYKGLVAFNDVEVIESYQGALKDIFKLARDEPDKLSLMAAAFT